MSVVFVRVLPVQDQQSPWFLCPTDIAPEAVRYGVDRATHDVVYMDADGQQLRRVAYRDMPVKPWSSDEWPHTAAPTRN